MESEMKMEAAEPWKVPYPFFLKVVLFHSKGHGNHHNVTLNFISGSSSRISELLNEVYTILISARTFDYF